MASIKKLTRTRVDKATGKEITVERWRARYRDEAGKEHSHNAERKVDAQNWLDEQTAGLVRGDWVDPGAGKITFKQWWTQWADAQDWVTGTQESAQQVLDSVTFGDLPMRTITENHVKQWMKAMRLPAESRKAGLAASTRRTRYNYVRMCFGAAVRARVIRLDPTAAITAPKVPKSETKLTIPTPEQVGAALKVAPEGFEAFVAVCAFAGLRLGEAAALQVGDVDFLRKSITVERQIQGNVNEKTSEVDPKYGSGRTVYIAKDLVEALARHVEKHGLHGDDGYLFSHRGFVYNRNSAAKVWRSIRKRVGGMDEFTLHDLRHFYASGLIAEGCDVVTVQHALGHSTPTVTLNTYSHLWPKADERTRNAGASLMAAVAGATPNVAGRVRDAGA